MTDKQKIFAKEYIIDLNATKAARRSGYSDESAKSIGYELLNNDEVSELIQELIQERVVRCEISSDAVLNEFKNVGMSNIQDYLDDSLEMKRLSDIPESKARAIKAIKKTVIESEFGSKTVVEFTLHDKLSGLINIGKHIGFFEKDNAQLKPELVMPEINVYNSAPPLANSEDKLDV